MWSLKIRSSIIRVTITVGRELFTFKSKELPADAEVPYTGAAYDRNLRIQ